MLLIKSLLDSKNTMFFFLLISLFMLGCRNDRDKKKHESTTMICKRNLFVETYIIFGGGAFGGDKVSDYLTDSNNFRVFVGVYDNGDEAYSYECKGDSINIYKVIGISENRNRIVSRKTFNLLDLKRKKIFD